MYRSWEFLYRPYGHPEVPLRRGWVLGRTEREAHKSAKRLFGKRIKLLVVKLAPASKDGSIVLPIPKDPERPAFKKVKVGKRKKIVYTGDEEP